MSLMMNVGDIWLFDTSSILGDGADVYGRPISKREHWLVLDVSTATSHEMNNTIIRYLCLEDGNYRDKVFDGMVDLRGNPYYKKAA